MSNVAWMRHELRGLLDVYFTIRDVIEGVEAIKGRRRVGTTYVSGVNGNENIGTRRRLNDARRYLPQPNPHDTSEANLARYRNYLERAQWLGATAQTLDGLTGQIFLRDPEYTLPDSVTQMLADVDGCGNDFIQHSKRCVEYALAYGRGGLLVDFPSTDAGWTASDIANGAARPIVLLFAPWQIINWRTRKIGVQTVYSLIVLIDDEYEELSEFETAPILQYRVLKLSDDNTHTVEIWRRQTDASRRNGQFMKVDEYTPKGPDGKPFDRIPFTFFGSRNNDALPDKPPLQDLADVNIGHYRNSADYEETCYMLGQPTPWAAGLDKRWVESVWESKTIPLGSRNVIPLPQGGAMGLLEVTPNNMALEAMKHKEGQMIALGAKLLEAQGGGNPQSATGELIDETSETCVLTNIANNVGAAYAFAFRVAARFMGASDADVKAIKVKFNTTYQFQRMSAAERQELIAEWQRGAITTSEMRAVLRSTGVATLSLDDYNKEADADAQKQAERAGMLLDATTPPDPAPTDGNKQAGQASNPKQAPSGKGGA